MRRGRRKKISGSLYLKSLFVINIIDIGENQSVISSLKFWLNKKKKTQQNWCGYLEKAVSSGVVCFNSRKSLLSIMSPNDMQFQAGFGAFFRSVM